MEPHDSPVNGHSLACNPNPTPANALFLEQPARNEFCGAAGDGEANALGRKNYCGIDADDLTARIDQRTARIPRVQRRVGLDNIIDESAGATAHRAAQRAPDTDAR